MIVTFSLRGVLADIPPGKSLAHARTIPQGIALLEMVGNEFPVYVLGPGGDTYVHTWVSKAMRRPVPFNVIQTGGAVVAEDSVAEVRSRQGSVLFHVEADPERAEAVRGIGVPVFLLQIPDSTYPSDLARPRTLLEVLAEE